METLNASRLDGSPESKGTALIVEDSLDFREILAFVLQTLGYVMHKAICAFTLTLVAMLSKRVMERKRYNWRCDRLGCSLMDGFDLVRHVRTGDRNERDSKIVMLTAYDGPDYIETARNVGCDVVLPKPVDLANLEKVLTSLH